MEKKIGARQVKAKKECLKKKGTREKVVYMCVTYQKLLMVMESYLHLFFAIDGHSRAQKMRRLAYWRREPPGCVREFKKTKKKINTEKPRDKTPETKH